jgi:hypothetical protein
MSKAFILFLIFILCVPIQALSQESSAEQAQKLEKLSQELSGLKNLRTLRTIAVKVPMPILSQLVRDKYKGVSGRDRAYKNANYLTKLARTFPKATLLDLNSDGEPEWIIWSPSEWYGDHGEDIWIYRKTRSGYKQLLSTGIDFGKAFYVAGSSTNGYRDIVLGYGLTIYKFDGKQYQYI